MSSLETQNKELTSLIKNNKVSAIHGTNNFNRDPNFKERANNTRFFYSIVEITDTLCLLITKEDRQRSAKD